MRAVHASVGVGLLVALMATGTGQVSAQGTGASLRSDAPDVVHRHDEFAGVWDYNAEYSINIVTGRPEQNPRGAPPPRAFVAPSSPIDPAVDGGGPPATPFSPTAQAMREARDMARDLLEVPERLAFEVTDTAVTVTDDLGRSHTFPTDGRRERYRLGASEFSARVRWDGDRLRRDIEGTFGYRMSETYFLSPDASRLFVIVRVGDPGRGRRAPGFDRVYDRITERP